ncbi:small ribosomal subunit protein mS46 [Monosporozyma servazzii]
MGKMLAMQRVSRAMYSTEITQDFLKDLLSRAKKATTLPIKNPTNNPSNNNYNRGDRNNNRDNYRDNSRAFTKGKRPFNKKFVDGKRPQQTTDRQQNKMNNVPFHPMTSNISQETISSSMPKQPQFERSGKNIDGLDNDFLDVLDASETTTSTMRAQRFNKSNSKERRARSRSNNSNTNKGNSSGFIYMKPILPGVGKTLSKLIKRDGPQNFQLKSINPVDLLKYNPSLNVTPKSQWVSFILSSMNEAQFPLNREPNISYASLIKDQLEGSIKPNNTFTVMTPGFGNYIHENSYSVNIEREPQVENIDVSLSKDRFNEMVLGKYDQVKIDSPDSNDSRVKLSLQNCSNLSNDDKDWLYQVCSGSVPLSQIAK